MPYLNEFAHSLEALDMTESEEFRSLLSSAEELGIPHSPDVRYLSHNTIVRHVRLHYLEWGDPAAPPIVLLHGGNQSCHSWDLVSLHLADRYHVLAIDQRGHGDSEWARDADYTTRAMANDALAFIAQQGLERPLVIGHSMGGLVTMQLLVEAPKVPRGTVFVDVGPEGPEKGSERIREFIQRNVEFDDLEEFVERVVAYDPYRPREHIERTVRYNMIHRVDGRYISKSDRVLHDRALVRSVRGGIRAVGLETVGRFPCPSLVVRGADSNVLSAEHAQRFADALPDGRLVTVPECGHNVHSQNTPGFLEALAPFLDEVDGPEG